ncbi:MAG TPA: YceI family protein [Candidatus Dormibacteraeota bacterium]|nr:YceI family protein [Candidatus Dormibacteraeota bacterium]
MSALIIGVGASPGLSASFKVDPAQSSLVVQLFKDGVAARLGHDHVVHARELSGTVAYDPRNPEASSIQVAVDVRSLNADDPGTRRKFGLAGEPSASDRAEIDKAMKADGQLAAARFPSMTFTSTAIATQPDGRVLVTGRLTIRGVTNELKFPAQMSVEDARLRGRAQLKFKQSSFGYPPYSALLGAIKNKDEVILHIDLVAKAPVAAQ